MHQLGILMLTVKADEQGRINVDHDASFEPSLQAIESALSASERSKAAELRRRACAAAADYFMFVQDPHRQTRAR